MSKSRTKAICILQAQGADPPANEAQTLVHARHRPWWRLNSPCQNFQGFCRFGSARIREQNRYAALMGLLRVVFREDLQNGYAR